MERETTGVAHDFELARLAARNWASPLNLVKVALYQQGRGS